MKENRCTKSTRQLPRRWRPLGAGTRRRSRGAIGKRTYPAVPCRGTFRPWNSQMEPQFNLTKVRLRLTEPQFDLRQLQFNLMEPQFNLTGLRLRLMEPQLRLTELQFNLTGPQLRLMEPQLR